MTSLRKYLRSISMLVLAAFTVVLLPAPAAHAGMVGTADMLAVEQRTQLEGKIVDYLKRDEVRDQLVRQGVDPAQVEARVAAMSDQEIQSLGGRIDELPAGGDFLGAAVIIFLVLLFTDILGYTDIFPFVKKPR
ncbi:MAG: hypothetical protein DWQ09_17515 [Proteobacteria bacterium]|nr:MAG: hypothetical protein DWQ09_17515 [Pseudomonadota bacterium]QKK12019.1 MAG: PA2779 family protein [Pseudomonadota bacterium]